MLTIRIHNDGTGTDESANYDYTVDVNGEEIGKGRVEGHDRKNGWLDLVVLLVQAELANITDEECTDTL